MTSSIPNSKDQQKKFHTILSKWVDILQIAPWRVYRSVEDPYDPNHLAEITTYPKRQLAAIRCNEKLWRVSDAELEMCIIHELIHIKTSEMRREYDRQSRRLPSKYRQEYIDRYDDHLEQLVESLAVLLYGLKSKPS